MQKSRTSLDHFFIVIKGLLMGTANKVPGVSGGIVAFVGGFYEEFIQSLQRINGKAFGLLRKGEFKTLFAYTNAKFLLLLTAGMLTSYFSVSRLLDYFLQQNELLVWSFFFGLVLGSIYYISRSFDQWTKKSVIAGIVGLVVGISISFLNPATENDNLFFIFFCGIISVSGMALPGLSGSFILILLGNYVLLLVDSVNSLYDTFAEIITGDFSFLQNPKRIRILKILAVFTTGSVTGLVSLSHVLNYLLKHYKAISTAVIIGFITGSLGVLWPWKDTMYKTDLAGNTILDSNGDMVIANYHRYIPNMSLTENWQAIGFVVLGIMILLGIDWYGRQNTQRK